MARLPLLMSAAGGSSVNVNGSVVPVPNFNATTPAAPGGDTNVIFQVSGSNISAYIPTSTGLYLPLTGGTLTGDLLFSLDNTHAIGAAGATRPSIVYAGTSMIAPLFNAATGFQIAGAAATAGHVLRADGTNYVDAQLQYGDIGGTTPTPPSGAVLWSALGNAAADLTLANAGFKTTFNQTSAVAWLWANTTVASNITTNASPLLELSTKYWDGGASQTDLWTLGASLAAGTNGASTLTFTHSGSAGTAAVQVPLLTLGGTDAGLSRLGAGSLALGNGAASDFSGTLKLTILNAATGIQIAGAAASGNYLRGNGANFVSSAIQAADLPAFTTAGTGFFWGFYVNPVPGTVTALTCAASLVIRVFQFVLPYATKVNNIITRTGTIDGGVGTKYGVAIYDISKNLVIDSGLLDLHVTSTVNQSTPSVGAGTILAPGVYYFAYAASNATGTLTGWPVLDGNLTVSAVMNKDTVRIGTAANAWSASTSFPATLGVITAGSLNTIPQALFTT